MESQEGKSGETANTAGDEGLKPGGLHRGSERDTFEWASARRRMDTGRLDGAGAAAVGADVANDGGGGGL